MKRIGDLEISKQYIQIENGKVIANNWMQEKINKNGIFIKAHSGNKNFKYTRKFSKKQSKDKKQSKKQSKIKKRK
jgi:hypothetical protein